jgi:plasmid stabilization system protein ParE
LILQWTTSANQNLVRLHAFLHPVNPRAAIQIVQQLVSAAEQLLTYPQLGERLAEFSPRNVRRLIVDDYEFRYKITDTTVFFCVYGMAAKIGDRAIWSRLNTGLVFSSIAHRVRFKF